MFSCFTSICFVKQKKRQVKNISCILKRSWVRSIIKLSPLVNNPVRKLQPESLPLPLTLLLSDCACSLEYSSLSTLAGLSYHICGKLEVAFKASPSSQNQHCTDEAQQAGTVLSAVIYICVFFYFSFWNRIPFLHTHKKVDR